MIAWFLANRWAMKLLGGIALLAVGALMLRWYGNSRYEQGKADERVSVASEMEALKKAEFDARQKALEGQKVVLVEDKKAAAQEIAQNKQFHQQLQGMLDDRIDQIITEKELADAATIILDPSKRVSAIRALSAELASTPSPIYR